MLTYKGYTAALEIDCDAKVLAGRVLDVRDVIVFEGKTVVEVEQEFHNSIDDYLEWCAEEGREPEKQYSGRLPFRTTPENHRMIARAAARADKSINAWMEELLVKAASTTSSAMPRMPDIGAKIGIFQAARTDQVNMDDNADRLIGSWPTSMETNEEHRDDEI